MPAFESPGEDLRQSRQIESLGTEGSLDLVLRAGDAGTRLAGQLEQVHTGKSGPLSKHYWAMTASGTGGQYSANVNVVKARDIEEDWGFEPLTKDEIEEFIENAHVLEDVDQIPDRKEFKQVLRDLDD